MKLTDKSKIQLVCFGDVSIGAFFLYENAIFLKQYTSKSSCILIHGTFAGCYIGWCGHIEPSTEVRIIKIEEVIFS